MLILPHDDEQRNKILERLEREGLIRNCYKKTTLTIEEALRVRPENKYSLEFENEDNYYPDEKHVKEIKNREFSDLAEALKKLFEIFTKWTKEMSTTKTGRTFSNGYKECEANYMYFDKAKSTEELEKIYSIDEKR
ncbi:19444_t:CDS:2 [Gigaspora rosea]|nr:19444_t:CDS:2 [Gigaspora rosea]